MSIQQLISTTRLERLHFRQLLTASRPLPHEETSLCPAIASLVSVRLEPTFVLGTTFDVFCHRRHCLYIATDRPVVSEQTSCPRTPFHASAGHILELVRFAVFVLQAAHTWTRARFVPRCRSQPDPHVQLHLSSADQSRP